MEEAVGTPGLASPSPPRLEYCKMRPVLQNGKQLVLRCSVPGPCPACMFPAIPKSQKKFTRPFLPAYMRTCPCPSWSSNSIAITHVFGQNGPPDHTLDI